MINCFSSVVDLYTYLILIGCIKLSVQDETVDLEAVAYSQRPECFFDYSYVVTLFNHLLPDIICLGAIISERWIVDNCQTEKNSSLTYTTVKVGITNAPKSATYYSISKSICHENYSRECFNINGYDTRYMYAARHAICLHRTSTPIKMDYTVHPIGLYEEEYYSSKHINAIYLYDNKLLYTVVDLPIVEDDYCNEIFFPYFQDGMEMVLTEDQACIKSHERITPRECCQSQALLISNDCKLVGVMGWSTACSQTLGVQPWVFTLVNYYRGWIETHYQKYL